MTKLLRIICMRPTPCFFEVLQKSIKNIIHRAVQLTWNTVMHSVIFCIIKLCSC